MKNIFNTYLKRVKHIQHFDPRKQNSRHVRKQYGRTCIT